MIAENPETREITFYNNLTTFGLVSQLQLLYVTRGFWKKGHKFQSFRFRRFFVFLEGFLCFENLKNQMDSFLMQEYPLFFLRCLLGVITRLWFRSLISLIGRDNTLVRSWRYLGSLRCPRTAWMIFILLELCWHARE